MLMRSSNFFPFFPIYNVLLVLLGVGTNKHLPSFPFSVLKYLDMFDEIDEQFDEQLDKRFGITSITRADVACALCGELGSDGKEIDEDRAETLALAMDDDEMKRLASQMANDYIETLFWTQIRAFATIR